MDIVWAALLTFVSSGPVSPLFLFFIFVVLSAAYRWGFVGTIATTAVTIGVFLLEIAIANVSPWKATIFASNASSLNVTILRVGYLSMTGFLLSYLAEQEKQSRGELAALADVMEQPRVELGLGGSVTAVSRVLLQIFRAPNIDFVLQDYDTRQTFLWSLSDRDDPEKVPVARMELSDSQEKIWLFADPAHAWHGTRARNNGALTARLVTPGAWPLRRDTVQAPPEIASTRSFDNVIVANLGLADQWRGRIYLYDAARGGTIEQSVHFMDALTEHIAPTLTNVFLLRRLRARISAAERAKVARELHDGAIQALFGVEMKVQALRRSTDLSAEQVKTELEEIQELLRREVPALRELMQALRPIELDASDQLPDVLASVVERFRRDTGVPARFVFSGGAVVLPSATALELVRIVQEALVNVRKHSRAKNVMVRLTRTNSACLLVIEDDGVGFEFEGHLSDEELERRRIGPTIIKERARIAGARLAIESAPGTGARLEIAIANHA